MSRPPAAQCQPAQQSYTSHLSGAENNVLSCDAGVETKFNRQVHKMVCSELTWCRWCSKKCESKRKKGKKTDTTFEDIRTISRIPNKYFQDKAVKHNDLLFFFSKELSSKNFCFSRCDNLLWHVEAVVPSGCTVWIQELVPEGESERIRPKWPVTYQRPPLERWRRSPEQQGNIGIRFSPHSCVKASGRRHLKEGCRCATGIGRCCTNCHCLQLKTGYIFDLQIGLRTEKNPKPIPCDWEPAVKLTERKRSCRGIRWLG